MESLGKNPGFLDGDKRIAFTAADIFLRRNGFCLEAEGAAGSVLRYSGTRMFRTHPPLRVRFEPLTGAKKCNLSQV
jgi:prophage maintenance system killer protein